VSPTTAHHVLAGLGDKVELILDGGPCGRGIESTVVDCTTTPPRILRPGPLTREALETVVGGPVEWPAPAGLPALAAARSPGQQQRHYAPRTPLELSGDGARRAGELLDAGRRVGLVTTRSDDPATRALAASLDLLVVPMPADPDAYARMLYATLHALDQRDLDAIVVEEPPATEPWKAVHDRLRRASA
jgi:L-threonylcarbamoyladenylate synthase